ncbi:MAG: hypothetical protein FWF05_08585 [Oscillospiraceae bacterium]|nr:hypothetical protein [Oscillospiraceae bacterium]
MPKNRKNALQTQEKTGFLALADADFGIMMADELDGLDLSFDKIKIPSAGSTVFEVPDEDGEPDSVKEFSAVILYHHPLFCFYKTKYTGGNQPPDCGSFDGVTGVGDPDAAGVKQVRACKKCPLNQYESAEEGKGKACKNRRRIYVLREGEVFPLLLSLPTGSLKEFTNYLKRLLSKGKKSNSVVTRFSLKKATNQGGVVYSQAQFAVDRALSPEERALVEKLSAQVKAFSGNVAFDAVDEERLTVDVVVDEETGEVIEALN